MYKFTILSFLFCLTFMTSCYSLHVESEEHVVIPSLEPKQPVRLALVLGGGGAKGLAHLGAIQELERAGIRPDLIVGCSSGAIAGALYADEPDLTAAIKGLISLRKGQLLDYAYINPIFGIVNGELLHNLMKKLLHVQTFEELKIPLIVVATDLLTGDVLEFSSGDLASAIRASCAIPGIFKPVFLYGRYCIDGGAAAPIPVEVAKKYGASKIIAIDLSERLPKESPKHLFDVTARSLEIAYRKFIDQSLAQADLAIRMNFDDLGATFRDDLNEWLYEQGRLVIREHLPTILALLEEEYPSPQEAPQD
jgi:NTE family protein